MPLSAKCSQSLEASKSVSEVVECKHRCVNCRTVSDPRRAFRPAFRVTGISDDCYRSTMGVIVIGLGTPQRVGENFGCTWEHLRAPTISPGAPKTSLGAPGSAGIKSGSADDKSGSTSDKSGSTSNHSGAVWEKQHLLWECCWCAWKL
jgi:hypothetical protein